MGKGRLSSQVIKLRSASHNQPRISRQQQAQHIAMSPRKTRTAARKTPSGVVAAEVEAEVIKKPRKKPHCVTCGASMAGHGGTGCRGRAEIEERAAEMVREVAVSAALAEAARVRALNDTQVIPTLEQAESRRELAARGVEYSDPQEDDDMRVDEEEPAAGDNDKLSPPMSNFLSPATQVRIDSETGSVNVIEPDVESEDDTGTEFGVASSDTSSSDDPDDGDEDILPGTKFFENTRIPATAENAVLLAKERVEDLRTRKAYTEPLMGGRRIAPSGASTSMDLYRGGLDKCYEPDPRERSRRELGLFQSVAQKADVLTSRNGGWFFMYYIPSSKNPVMRKWLSEAVRTDLPRRTRRKMRKILWKDLAPKKSSIVAVERRKKKAAANKLEIAERAAEVMRGEHSSGRNKSKGKAKARV